MIGATLGGRFRLDREVAVGGMGAVYSATDLETKLTVAVKVMLAATVDKSEQRFDREIAVLKSLHHPGIAQLLSHGLTDSGAPYLVLEWVEGEVLRARLASAGLTPRDAVQVIRQVAEALGYAHQMGVIHRDIKPSNVMLPGAGGIKLIDFGVARYARSAASTAKTLGLTRTGLAIGTPPYMAPEQVSKPKDIDVRADVFALGCLLYECLTGHRAFSGGSMSAVWLKILHNDPPPVTTYCPEASPELVELLGRMLSKRPADRPPDAAAVAAQLASMALLPEGPPRKLADPKARAQIPARFEYASSSAPASDATRTVVLQKPTWLSVLTVGPASATSGDTTTEDDALGREARVLDVAARHSVSLRPMPDGSFAAYELGVEAAPLIERVARCALALCTELPGAAISIVSGEANHAHARDDVIDRTSEEAQASNLESIFADYAEPEDYGFKGVRLCATSAAVLRPVFEVVETSAAFRLLGDR